MIDRLVERWFSSNQPKPSRPAAANFDHIRINRNVISCAHCGKTHSLKLPIRIKELEAVSQQYNREHGHCQPQPIA